MTTQYKPQDDSKPQSKPQPVVTQIAAVVPTLGADTYTDWRPIFLALLSGGVAKQGLKDYDPSTGSTSKGRIKQLVKASQAIAEML